MNMYILSIGFNGITQNEYVHLIYVERVNETRSFSDFSSNDITNVLPNKTSCNYYPVNDFHTLKMQTNLNIFHANNVNGLGVQIG